MSSILWILKQLKAKGVIESVRVRVKDALPRELEKYYAPHVTRQSMATLMREHEKSGEAEDIEDSAEHRETGKREDVHDFTGVEESAIATTKKKPKTVPLSIEFTETHLKTLKKTAKKGGKKADVQLQGMIDELIESGELLAEQESLLWAALRSE